MHHRWATEDEERLIRAMEDCQPLIDHYRQTYTMRSWWDVVAGRMAPDVLVSGRACQTRYYVIQQRRADNETSDDKWLKVEEMVEVYEREMEDDIRESLLSLTTKLDLICRELGVAESDALQSKIDLLSGLLRECLSALSYQMSSDLFNRVEEAVNAERG